MVVDVKYVDELAAEWAMAYGEGEAYLIMRRDAVCPDALREAWETFLHLSGESGPKLPAQYRPDDRLLSAG